jgi:hypothetical protein
MIPTMLVAGFVLGLLPRRWPHASAVVVGLAVLASLGFGLLVGEPRSGGVLALANVAIGVGVGRAAQGLASLAARPRRVV